MYSERIESCGKRIAKALTIRDIRQSDLANMANIPKSSLSLYLKDAYEPKQDRIYSIAKILDVSEAWLMGYDVPMEKSESTPLREVQLTQGEQQLLDLFRLIPEEQQDAFLEMGRLFASTLRKD